VNLVGIPTRDRLYQIQMDKQIESNLADLDSDDFQIVVRSLPDNCPGARGIQGTCVGMYGRVCRKYILESMGEMDRHEHKDNDTPTLSTRLW
jgi:hypothetical protein